MRRSSGKTCVSAPLVGLARTSDSTDAPVLDVHAQLCPPTMQLAAWAAQFFVSRARIVANPPSKYARVKELLEAPEAHWLLGEGKDCASGPSAPSLEEEQGGGRADGRRGSRRAQSSGVPPWVRRTLSSGTRSSGRGPSSSVRHSLAVHASVPRALNTDARAAASARRLHGSDDGGSVWRRRVRQGGVPVSGLVGGTRERVGGCMESMRAGVKVRGRARQRWLGAKGRAREALERRARRARANERG